jgi:diguanylate cyclase (GGDEF)-like protein
VPEKLKERFRDLLSVFLQTEIDAMFEAADETLFQGARDAGSDQGEKAFLEAQQEAGKLKPPLSKAFFDNVMFGLGHLGEGPIEPIQGQEELGDDDDAGLSLVDTMNFGDILRVKQILGRWERRFKDSEYDLEVRLSKLFRVTVDQDSDPVGVRAVCFAFHDAIQNLGATRLARGSVFDAFEHTLIGKLADLQESFADAFEEAGVHGPGKERKYRVPKRPKAAPQPSEAPTPPAEPPVTAAAEGARPAAPVQPPAAPVPPAAVPTAAAPVAAVADAAAGFAAPGYAVPAGAPIALTDAFAAGRNLLQIGRQQTTVGTAAPTQPSVSPAVMSAVTRLQKQSATDPLSQTSPRAVVARVAKAVADSGETISEAEQDTVNIIASMLDGVLNDPLIGDGAKARLRRLTLPLIKVALSDASFFDDMSHPARAVVNQLGRIELDGDDESETEALVDPLVERLVNRPQLDSAAFAEELAWLERIAKDQTQVYTERVDEIADARKQQQALVKARVGTAKGAQATRRVPEELRQWLARARHIKVGDSLMLETRPGKRERTMLAWASDDKETFQFVDPHGNKGALFTAQQLAIELRRGSAKVLTGADLPAFDRGFYQMLHEIHHKLAEVATRDELTGLLNRREFEQHVENAVDRARREGSEHVLCVLDIDNFGEMNERCGRKAGDRLLRQLSRVLEKHTGGEEGSLARLEADAFGVLLVGVSQDEGQQFAERQRNAIARSRCVWKGESFPLSVSIGLVTVGPDSTHAGALLAEAQAACSLARDEGGNRVALGGAARSEPAEVETAEEAAPTPVVWSGDVKETLESENLVLRAQRVQPLKGVNGVKAHFEILLGVRSAEGEVLPPREFIQAAEGNSLMPSVDRWVIRNTFAWMARHRKEVMKSGGYAINLAASTLVDDSLIDYILAQLTESKVPPAKVVFELKEEVVLQSLSNASDFVRVLKEYGCRSCLDHFGTGDASFSYLKRLSVDYLKIDGSFVRDMLANPNDLAVVKSVNEVGHLLGIQTIALFVENDATLEPLREIGVDFAQGFAIARPEVL